MIVKEQGHSSSSDIMEDYCDGEAFKSHCLFSLHANTIQILFYFDKLELTNPIGTKAKIHKLGMYLYVFMLAVCGMCTCRNLLFNNWQLTTKVQIPTVVSECIYIYTHTYTRFLFL